jgi:ABC-type amino acid transport substrate-binding protein
MRRWGGFAFAYLRADTSRVIAKIRVALARSAAFALALASLTAPAFQAAAQSVSGELPSSVPERVLSDDERAYLKSLGPIRIAVDPDWRPYEWIDQSGAYKGIAADLIKLMAERLGLEVEIVKTPDWPTSLELAKSGGAHVLAFLNRSPAREEWLLFTEPYFVDPNVFITRQDQDFIADPARLGAKTVVFPEGTSLEEHVRRRYPNLRVITAPSEEEAFRMVQDGRADMTLRSLTMAAYVLRRDGLFDLKIAGQYPDFSNQFRFGVVKSKPELRDILDKAVAAVTPDDVQAAINRYISIEARA